MSLTLSDYARHSDHTPIFADLKDYGTAMSWNILTRCEWTDENKNNSWHENEDAGQYFTRLRDIVQDIKQTVESHSDLSLIALQEVPFPPLKQEDSGAHDMFIKDLQQALGDHWTIPSGAMARTGTSRFGNLILVNENIFANPQPFDLTEKIHGRQQNRSVGLILQSRTTLPPLHVVNVHLRHFGPMHPGFLETSHQLHALVEAATGPMLVLGDFNRPPHSLGKWPDSIDIVKSLAKKPAKGERARNPIDIDYFLCNHWPATPTAILPDRWRRLASEPRSSARRDNP